MKDIIIIGAGPAGMMAAIKAKEINSRLSVIILEKKDEVGKKLKITGKGRCNITFDGDFEYFKKNITVNPKFMYSSYHNFTNYDLIKFVNSLNVDTKLERGNRYFLSSDDASQLCIALKQRLKELNVTVRYSEEVTNVSTDENNKKKVTTIKNEYLCDSLIITTGGASYKNTGSTGDGYEFAKELGHTVTKILPGLVGIKSNDSICKELQGVTLKNVAINITDSNKVIYNDFGEMLFTHFGISGPIILSSSSKVNRVDNLEEKLNNNSIVLHIDLKPALSKEVLDKRLQKDFAKYTNKEFRNALNDLLPKSLIEKIILITGIDEFKKVHQITKEERLKLLEALKNFKININGLMSIDTGIVTCGGVSVKEINPKTLESKLVKGVYFAGEVIDLDAYTGGFNLQIAFSTGYTAGLNAAVCED